MHKIIDSPEDILFAIEFLELEPNKSDDYHDTFKFESKINEELIIKYHGIRLVSTSPDWSCLQIKSVDRTHQIGNIQFMFLIGRASMSLDNYNGRKTMMLRDDNGRLIIYKEDTNYRFDLYIFDDEGIGDTL